MLLFMLPLQSRAAPCQVSDLLRHSDVIDRLTRRLFGSPLLRNSIRGEVVEEIVAMALEPAWQHCAGDWAAYDLRHVTTGFRMQVKQSAARQSWHSDASPTPRPRFSIATKTGRYEGPTWIAEPGRNADLFVFAWHPRTDASADHRDPEQWLFYVVSNYTLPAAKSLSLQALSRLVEPVGYAGLGQSVASFIPR